MVTYELPEGLRRKLALHHREVQYLICVLANQKLHHPPPPTNSVGIWKSQGGVRVGRAEICIRANAVMDDFRRHDTAPTAEEQAVVEAIIRVANEFRRDGVGVFTRYGVPNNIVTKVPYDPLRSMFGIN